jgi:hypothetical protein
MRAYEIAVVVPFFAAMAMAAGALVSAARRAGVGAAMAGAVALWLAIVFGLARVGVFRRFDALPPRVMVAAMACTAALVAFSRGAAGRRFVAAASLAGIAGLQCFRVPVEVALHALYTRELVPVQMTWSGRNFDVLVGLTAPFVALALHRGRIGLRALAAWHVASLAMLVNIVATAAMSFPGPLRRFHEGVSAAVVAEAPFVWLPAFLVPVAAASHLVSLLEIARSHRDR